MSRKNINTTLDEELYKQIRILALQKGTNANVLIEKGMKYVLEKYTNQNNNKSKTVGDINE